MARISTVSRFSARYRIPHAVCAQVKEGNANSQLPSKLPIVVECADALDCYEKWPTPITIISDGPYGVSGYPGDPPTADRLAQCYEPHVAAWSRFSSPQTTLWFWNTEVGWANVHQLLVRHGWQFRNCHVWNKGKGHVAGNANTKSLRKFPVVTEVCVQYVREARFRSPAFGELSMKEWLRHEWQRTGLPFKLTNVAAGVKDAATRKYFTMDHLWYFPPPDIFEKMVKFANLRGEPAGRPYFSTDGIRPLTAAEWARMRAKFHCEFGINNVWHEPAVRGIERLKDSSKVIHGNQKPLRLIELCLRASSDPGDVVWDPFGGLCTTAIAAKKMGRACYAAEIRPEYFRFAMERIKNA